MLKRANFKIDNNKKFEKSHSNNKYKNGHCFNCGKKDHFIKDFRFKKNNEKKDNNIEKSNNADLIEKLEGDFVAIVVKMQIGMVELNMAPVAKTFDR